MSIMVLLFTLVSFLITIGIGVLVGFLVYRDANNRAMTNPILWALLVVFAPSFIGLIIYLIVRSSYPKNSLPPSTDYPYSEDAPQKNICSFCGCTIQGGYVNCPHCGTSLQSDVTK